MENEFGGRFIKLFRGPMWSGCSVTEMKNPEKVSRFSVKMSKNNS